MSKLRTTTCPFCLNGCMSGVLFDGYRYEAHYPSEGKVNRGHLCPRGNSASIVIDHRDRLCRPVLDGRDITWQEAERLVRNWLGEIRADELALVYGRGRTLEEVQQLHGLARQIGTPNLVCGHIEPENSLAVRLEGVETATLEQVEKAQTICLIGDVFSTSPVISSRILDSRYADRRNRLIVIDSIRTRQSGFAHQFIQVIPGTEPFALLALTALIDSRLLPRVQVDHLAELAGVRLAELQTAAAAIGAKRQGFVGCALHFGRVRYPWLTSMCAQLVAAAAKQPFLGIAEALLPAGTMRFSALRKTMAAGGIRLLFWTGGLFPCSYPELMPELGRVEHVIVTSIFRPEPVLRGLVLPLTAELERASKGTSYWGPVERLPLASPLSGSREFSEVLAWFGRAAPVDVQGLKPTGVEEVLNSVEVAIEQTGRGDGVILLGEKKAIGVRGFYDREEKLFLSHGDAVAMELREGDIVVARTSSAEVEFEVQVTDSVVSGTAAVGVNVHRNRALFPIVDDPLTGETTVPMTQVTLVKTGRRIRPVGDNPSVWA